MRLQSDIWVKTNINDCATMSRSKSRHSASADTKDTRLAALQTFVKGDRVRHKLNGKIGVFAGINLGFALPEVWVVFDSDTDSRIPISCNPTDLELAQKDCCEHQLIRELEMLENTEFHKPKLQDSPEVELIVSSSDHTLKAEAQTISDVHEMATTVDDATVAAVRVVEELTEEEAASRHRLEIKVERAFREAGLALAELRNRQLYRSTHKTWDAYCKDRFGYGRDAADLRILAAAVVEEIERVPTNRRQILPMTLEQVRPLTKLQPDLRIEVWQQAVQAAGGKVPSGRIVKGVVERLMERDCIPTPIPYKLNDVFLISAASGELKKYSGCWAIATQINEYTVCVLVHDGDLTVKPENLEPIDSSSECEQVRAVALRITRLRQRGLLDRGAYYVLEGLGRQTFLTEVEEGLLIWLENHYGVI